METWALIVEISRLGLEMEEILMKLDGIGDGQGRRPVKKVERRSRLWRLVVKPMFLELVAIERMVSNLVARERYLALLKKKKKQQQSMNSLPRESALIRVSLCVLSVSQEILLFLFFF